MFRLINEIDKVVFAYIPEILSILIPLIVVYLTLKFCVNHYQKKNERN